MPKRLTPPIQPDITHSSNPWIEHSTETFSAAPSLLASGTTVEEALAALAAGELRDTVESPGQVFWRLLGTALSACRIAHHTFAAVLAGLAVGWQLCGMQTMTAANIDPFASTATMVAVIALLLAALGMGIPERAMLLVRRVLPHRFQNLNPAHEMGSSDDGWLLGVTPDHDASLPWLSVAMACSVSGVLVIVWLAVCQPAAMMYDWLLARFFWTNLSLAALEWFGMGLLLLVPCLIHGLIFVTLSATATARAGERRDSNAGVWAGGLTGAALAWLLHGEMASHGVSAEREVLIGSLPMFALAVLAARLSKRAETGTSRRSAGSTVAPELPLTTETLLRGSSAIWGVGATAVFSGWLSCQAGTVGSQAASHSAVGAVLLCLAIGFVIASYRTGDSSRWTRSAGPAVWTSGCAAGAAAVLFANWPFLQTSTLLQIAMLAFPLGYSLHHVSHSWIARSPSRALGFAQIGVTLLTGTAIGLAVSRWWTLTHLGPMGTWSAGSLVLLATGGLLEIYEENRPVRIQRIKLALVFASLAGAIVFYPAGTRAWTRRERELSVSKVAPPGPGEAFAEALSQVRTACVIGVKAGEMPAELPPRITDIDLMSHARRTQADTALNPDKRLHVIPTPAARSIRLTHNHYQLIYQLAHPARGSAAADCSAEWFTRLADHLTNGGTLMVELPLAGLSRRDLATLAATFQHAAGMDCTWTVLKQPEWRIVFRNAGTSTPAGIRWRTLDSLLQQADAVAIHSARHGHLDLDGPDNADILGEALLGLATTK
jgi:hypothetical protein